MEFIRSFGATTGKKGKGVATVGKTELRQRFGGLSRAVSAEKQISQEEARMRIQGAFLLDAAGPRRFNAYPKNPFRNNFEIFCEIISKIVLAPADCG